MTRLKLVGPRSQIDYKTSPLKRTSTIEVVCFGEILWDIFESGPRGDDPIAWSFRRELGGAPANVATGLARLGVRSSICGGIGRDKFGDALASFLAKEHVSTDALIRLPNRTGLTFVTRDAKGEPSFLFYRHESADVSIEASHLRPEMARARFALVGTSTLMTPSLRAATHRFVELAEKANASLVVDLNVRAHLWPSARAMRAEMKALVGHAAIVKASSADLAALVGTEENASSEKAGLAWLRANAPRATWLVTRGADVASAIGPHGSVDVPARRASCVDATGAGDAFLAGSLATLLAHDASPSTESWNDRDVWTRALEVGHMLGAKVVSRVGAVSGLVGLTAIRAKLAATSKIATKRRT